MVQQIVVTSLDWILSWEDGTATAFLSRLKAVLATLKDNEVAVVGFTGCDRAEIEPIRADLNWHDPFITESGSAIFTPASHNPFLDSLGELDGDYFVEELGCPYVQARAGLRVLANLISHPLKGYGDFTVPQLEKFLKVSETVAHRAKAREFSEPFMTPKAVEAEALVQAAKEMGFGVVLRDPAENRFSELVGGEASLKGAIAKVVDAYQQSNTDISVVLIGDGADLQQIGEGKWAAVEVRSPDEWLEALEKSAAVS